MNQRLLLTLLLVCSLFSVARAETEGFAYTCETLNLKTE